MTDILPLTLAGISELRAQIETTGLARLPAATTLALLGLETRQEMWEEFSVSWQDLGPDLYMADGGRYRRRRHAVFDYHNGQRTRLPHQPHFQSRDYNRLNGDVQRWFDPVTAQIADSAVTDALFALCADGFALEAGRHYEVELHQFRIEAQLGSSGRPTPEGMHRDGVDHVLVMLIRRENVREGVTQIGAPKGTPLGEFTLAEPGDAMMIDDRRILHGVTEIHADDPARPAWRDALVLTFVAK